MKYKNIHCLFEQSGTFKNEFKSLGQSAYDYDILNEYNETDFQIDLYKEIEKAYNNEKSIFDNFTSNDLMIAFFPCIRFEDQIGMHFRGTAYQQRKKCQLEKLEKDLELHEELHENYKIVTKLSIIALRKKIPLIIENPYSTQHYLIRYWALEPKIIDEDRRENGDYYKKPTMYYFIGIEPKTNYILFEPIDIKENKNIVLINDKAQRSMISKDYANRFIREYII